MKLYGRCCNMSYLSYTHLELKSHKNLLDHNLFFSCPTVSKNSADHGNDITMVCAKFHDDWATKADVMDERDDISLSLRWSHKTIWYALCVLMRNVLCSNIHNLQRAGTELIKLNIVNIMVADALAPCVARTSAPWYLYEECPMQQHPWPSTSGAELIQLKIVNIMVTDGLAPCVPGHSTHDIDYAE